MTCYCGSNLFKIRIGESPKHKITLICSRCKCERIVTTPGRATHYSLSNPPMGFLVDEKGFLIRKENVTK